MDTAEPIANAAPVQEAPASPPTDAFIVVPIRGMVLFPQIVLPIVIGGPVAIAAAQQAVREQRQIVVLLQRDPTQVDPAADGMHTVGVVANILRYVTAPNGEHHIICQGVQRFHISRFVEGWPYLVARGELLPEPTTADADVEARFINLRAQALEILDLVPQAPAELRQTVASIVGERLEDVLAERFGVALFDRVLRGESDQLYSTLVEVNLHLDPPGDPLACQHPL